MDYGHSFGSGVEHGLDSTAMKTGNLAAIVIVVAVVPILASFACNKKEDLAPAPSATQAAASPPPPAPVPSPQPTPTITAATALHAQVRAAAPGDAGRRDGAVVSALSEAGTLALPPGLPPIPTLHPSQLPGIASGIVGGIVRALPSGLIPVPPPAPSP